MRAQSLIDDAARSEIEHLVAGLFRAQGWRIERLALAGPASPDLIVREGSRRYPRNLRYLTDLLVLIAAVA